jgi:hypothetical protein
VVAMFSLFLNIALSLYLGKLLGEIYLGFLIVSAIYLFLSIVIYFYSNKLIKIPLTNLVIEKLLKEKNKINNSNLTTDENV